MGGNVGGEMHTDEAQMPGLVVLRKAVEGDLATGRDPYCSAGYGPSNFWLPFIAESFGWAGG